MTPRSSCSRSGGYRRTCSNRQALWLTCRAVKPTKENELTKNQKRGNREAKKPKAARPNVVEALQAKGLPTSPTTALKTKR